MKLRQFLFAGCLRRAVLMALTFLSASAFAAELRETVLYSFQALTDGGYPMAGLIFGKKGVLYGTAVLGGNFDACNEGGTCGVVFTLTPPSQTGGTWTENALYTFQFQDPYPPSTNLTFDLAGNLYGATGDNTQNYGIFQLRDSNGKWTLKTLDTSGGNTPIFDSKGNLYDSVASFSNNGTVVELSRQPGDVWVTTTLYTFNEGYFPTGKLIFDSAGNLYGTTSYGGSSQCGNVYELSPQGNGTWVETTLWSFSGSDGCNPNGGVIFDRKGNLYGTTIIGGVGSCPSQCGVVFELSPPAQNGGPWTETVLHSFVGADGAGPLAGLVMNSAGALYGTTVAGGNGPCEPTGTGCGTVFRLAPPSQPGGAWRETFYSFQGPDGQEPFGNVLLDVSKGVLYGTTYKGGANGYGVVFEMTAR